MSFNLEDYEPVATRLDRWWAVFGMGRVLTKVVHADAEGVCVRAELYRDSEDERPYASGYAEETREGHVNKTSALENCETSAIGRALANAGYAGSDPAKRASREEMSKMNRGRTTATDGAGHAAPKATDKQKGLITRLLNTKDYQGEWPEVSKLTKREASALIDTLQECPDAEGGTRAPTVDEAVAKLGGERVEYPEGEEPF